MGQIKNIKLHIVTDIKQNRSIMGKPQRKKRTHKNIKDFKKSIRTRKRKADIDEIHHHMEPDRVNDYLHQKVDPDLPGDGQFYCVPCARHFINQTVFTEHKKTKNHKKRLRLLKETPYTQLEAEAAAGMGSYTVTKDKKTDDKQKENDAMVDGDADVSVPALVDSVDDIIDKMNLT